MVENVLDRDTYGIPAGAIRMLVAFVLAASLMGRALAQALPGSRTGIGPWIVWTERAAALISQLFVVAAVAVALRLLSITLRVGGLNLPYRISAVALSGVVITLALVATHQVLGPEVAAALALCAALLPLLSTPRVLSEPVTRLAGLVLTCVALAAICHIAARVLAIRAGELGVTHLVPTARAIATISFFFDVFSLAAFGAWLLMKDWRKGAMIATVMIGLSAALAWGAQHGSQHAAPIWKVLAARIHTQILGHPAPFIPGGIRFSVELLAWFLAALGLFSRSRPAILAGLLSLAVLTRASTDVPALALSLLVAALLAPLIALRPPSTASSH